MTRYNFYEGWKFMTAFSYIFLGKSDCLYRSWPTNYKKKKL